MEWLVRSIVLCNERLEERVLGKKKEEVSEGGWIWGWTGFEIEGICAMIFWVGNQKGRKREFMRLMGK